MDFVLIQVIGGIAYALLTASYYKKEKSKILYMQIMSYAMFTVHYYFLSGVTGAICNLIGLLALITIYSFEKYKWKHKKLISIIFIILLIIVNILTFQNIYSIFPLIASVIAIVSFLMNSEEIIRGIGIVSAICWLVYAIVYKSYISIVFEVVTLVGVVWAFIKNKKNKNEENKPVKKAGCILINKDKKEIALVCRKGEYSFPKGHLEENESIQDCAIRETIEETGNNCHLFNDKELGILNYKDSKKNQVECFMYIAIDDGTSKKKLKEKNREQTIWVKFDEIEKTLSHQNLIDFWNKIKNKVEEVI